MKHLENLLAALAEQGVTLNTQDRTEKEIEKVAKSMGLDPIDYVPREVQIIEHTNKREETNDFIKTPPFVVGRKKNGMAQTVRGFFLRREALPQAIADLKAAQELLDAEDEE